MKKFSEYVDPANKKAYNELMKSWKTFSKLMRWNDEVE
jgi:hypothetical protein